jgi:hypothetical protein
VESVIPATLSGSRNDGSMRQNLTATFVSLLIAGTLSVTGCASRGVSAGASPAASDSAVYVALLGQDTAYYQWVVRRGNDVTIDVVERIPRVRLLRTAMTQNPDGSLLSFERRAYLPSPSGLTPSERVVVRLAGDSTIIETTGSGPATRHAPLGRGHIVVPAFLQSSYPVLAPYAPERVGDSIVTRLFSQDFGDRSLTIKRAAADTIALRSDILGTIRVHLDAQGRVAGFSGIGSSINTVGARVAWLPVDSVLQAFVARERAAGVVGTASPRDSARASISGATVVVDYGRPSKRGRRVFGGIVPFNRVWRTGANRATHLMIDRTLRFGEAQLPPGSYTLWTIPAESGWTLVVNNQTGQWGTDHDPRFDRFRVPMRVTALPESVERFTIVVEPAGAGGVIRLRWDTVEASVPFTVVR